MFSSVDNWILNALLNGITLSVEILKWKLRTGNGLTKKGQEKCIAIYTETNSVEGLISWININIKLVFSENKWWISWTAAR